MPSLDLPPPVTQDIRLTSPHLLLPFPFSTSPTPPTLLTQGAEALVYRTSYPTPSVPVALKFRPRKPYRHPVLDARLTRSRLLSEARVLLRCRRAGIDCPNVVGADWEAGWVALEWIEGWTVRRVLDWWCKEQSGRVREGEAVGEEQPARSTDADREEERVGLAVGEEDTIYALMRSIGRAIAQVHALGVVHGDLTTSNLMLRRTRIAPPSSTSSYTPISPEEDLLPPTLTNRVALIDFGLTSSSIQDEDRAVDLYVLERAFAATHPAAEPLFGTVLEEYGTSYKGAKVVLKRLEDVRMRGRKRSMLG